MSTFDQIAQLVRDANPQRDVINIHRRTIKLIEELGEVAQAFLLATSPTNDKRKTWDDVREEIADCLIVSLDIGWTVLRHEVETPTSFEFPSFNESLSFDDSMIFQTAWYVGKFGRDFVRSHITQVIHHVMIMSLCAFPDQPSASLDAIEQQLLVDVQRKLAKWAASRPEHDYSRSK